MGAELSLFDNTIEMSELVALIERVADHKAEGYHMSFGVSKGASGHKTYTTIIVLQTKQRKNERQIFQGTSVRNLLEQTHEYLKTL
jgi:hypothetical protein